MILAASAPAQNSSGIASLTYPQNGAAQVDPTVQFTWTPISSAQAYYLYVGSAPGLKDVYDSGETSQTALTISVSKGTTYYARLYTEVNNTWSYAPDISFTTVLPSALLSPSDQATDLQPTIQFTWTQVAGASSYYLYVGTSPGANDIVNSGELPTTHLIQTLNPGVFFARIYTLINNRWYVSTDITFSVAESAMPSQLISPANGSLIYSSSSVTFSWTSVPSASVYYLYVGTTPGAKDIIDTGEMTATQLTRLLPAGCYYARIYTEISQVWYASTDVSFVVTNGSALAFPTNGSSGVDPYVNFSWPSFPGANAYSLSVGTSPGAADTLAISQTTATSYQVSAPLQPNTTYYVRLGTLQGTIWSFTDSTFTTGTGIAHLLSPVDGATNIDPFTKLSWTAVADAQAYYIYAGSAIGLKDVFDSGEIQATNLAIPSIQPDERYFIRLYTEKNSQWYSLDYTFTTGSGIAQMVDPADKAINVDPALPFRWSSDPRALRYQLSIGTSLGASDILDSGQIADTSLLVRVPVSGTYYIRLFTIRADGKRFVDSSFTLGDFVAHLVNPANQSLADPFAAFTWTGVPDAAAYYLTVGTSNGARDVFDSGELSGTSVFVTNLAPGSTYSARLYTYREGFWYSNDTTFVAGSALASLTDPHDAAIISPFETFSWSIPDFAPDAYYLIIGDAPGARDVFDSGALQATSVLPSGLDFGKTYYATLFTLKGGFWRATQSTFSTYDQDSFPDFALVRSAFYDRIKQATAAVRMMADPTNNAPVPGSPLATFLTSNNLRLATCVDYANVLKLQLISLGIKSRLRYITLTGTATEAHTVLEYYDPFLQKWSVADPTFGIIYYNPVTQIGQSVEEIQALVLASDFADLHVIPTTTYGETLLRAYYLDPLTLYTNITPPDYDHAAYGPQPNSPFQFLRQSTSQDLSTQIGSYLFGFGAASEQLQLADSNGVTTTLVPSEGTLFSPAIDASIGWRIITAPEDVKVYTFVRPIY